MLSPSESLILSLSVPARLGWERTALVKVIDEFIIVNPMLPHQSLCLISPRYLQAAENSFGNNLLLIPGMSVTPLACGLLASSLHFSVTASATNKSTLSWAPILSTEL